MKNLYAYIAILSGLGLAACAGTENSSTANGDSAAASFQQSKTNLDAATLAQIQPYVSECRHHQLCVEICHRPPGNPAHSKTMHLPLAATRAHLHHGGSHHSVKDSLGACGSPTSGGSSDDESSSGGQTGGDVGTDPGAGTSPATGSATEIPLWCHPYLEVDSNCDGFNDLTGEAYL